MERSVGQRQPTQAILREGAQFDECISAKTACPGDRPG